MNVVNLALRNLLYRKARSILAIAGISIGVTAYIILQGFSIGLYDTFRKASQEREADLIIFEGGNSYLLGSILEDSIVVDVQDVDGVENVAGVLLDRYRYKRKSGLVCGWDRNSYLLSTSRIIQGRKFRAGKKEILIGDLAAKNFKKSMGDTFHIGREYYAIVGVYAGGNIFLRNGIIMELAQLQKKRSMEGKINLAYLKIKASSAKEQEKIINNVKAALYSYPKEVTVETNEQIMLGDNRMLNLVRVFTRIIALISLCLVIVTTINIVMISVFEKIKEIGIIMAIGWSKFAIMRSIIYEALLLTSAGGGVGIFFGCILLKYLLGMPQLEGLIIFHFSFLFIAHIAAIVVMVGVFSAVYPVLRVLKLSVTETFNYG